MKTIIATIFLFLFLFLSGCSVATKKEQYIAAEIAWKKHTRDRFMTDQEQKDLKYGQD